MNLDYLIVQIFQDPHISIIQSLWLVFLVTVHQVRLVMFLSQILLYILYRPYLSTASPTSVLVRGINAITLEVSWGAPLNELASITGYAVSCKPMSSALSHQSNITLAQQVGPSNLSVVFDGILPDAAYHCCVKTRVTEVLSTSICANGRTPICCEYYIITVEKN